MKSLSKHALRVMIVVGLGTAVIPYAPTLCAQAVLPGWCLFIAVPTNTTAYGLSWQGIGYETFNFGSEGSQSVGDVNTVVQIQTPITTAGGSGNFQFVGGQFQTVSSVPADYFFTGSPAGYYYLTLNSSQPSSGTITISSFPSDSSAGSFAASCTAYWDVRYGSLTGTIVFADESADLVLTNGTWTTVAPDGALTLPGINYLLNGTNTSNDFWPSSGDTTITTNDVVRAPSWRSPAGPSRADLPPTLTFVDLSDPSIRIGLELAVLPTLMASRSGNILTVSWSPAGGTLQSTASLSPAHWAPVGSINPTNLAVGRTNLFLRVSVP